MRRLAMSSLMLIGGSGSQALASGSGSLTRGLFLFVKAGDFITLLFLFFYCSHHFPFSSSGFL
jgi:hypothetical protein